MTHPADPAGRPGDVPPYGHEAPYGPTPGGAAGAPSADAAPGASAPADAGAAAGTAHATDGGAHAAPPGTHAAPGSAHAAPGGAYAPPGAPPAGHAYGGYGGPTPYAGPGYWPRNDLGVWSLVLGIAGLVLACGFFTGIPAVIVGTNARRAIARGEANNDGMVTAGIVLGWVSIAFGVLMTVLVVLSFLVPLVFLGVTLPWASEMSSRGY